VNTILSLSPFLVVGAGFLGLPVTALLLNRYRRAVLGLMSARGDDLGDAGAVPGALDAGGTVRPQLDRMVVRRRRLHVAITVGAGLFVGCTYGLLYLVWNDLEILPFRLAFVVLMFAWPAIPGVWVASDGDRVWTTIAVAVYSTAVVGVGVVAGLGAVGAVASWASFNLLPTIVVVAFFTRTFRAVGVCVLGVMLAAVAGSITLVGSLQSDAVARGAVEVASALGVNSGPAVFWTVVAIGFAGAGAAGLWVFVRLGHWYSDRRFSDHMLLLGSLCFVFCIDYVVSVGFGSPVVFALGLGLFAALAVITIAVFRRLVPAHDGPARLLVLRVFDHTGKAHLLLDRVGARWRFIGPVRMIGGPDLASSNIEPNEFLTFLGGRLRHLFISNFEALGRRFSSLVSATDPDGRFRVEEWFCFDTTWRAAVEGLVARSDAVLMDLRGFTDRREGAVHELEVLAHAGAFPRTVLVVDHTTLRPSLDTILASTGSSAPSIVTADKDDPRPIVGALLSRAVGVVA
jgi:hypothetical protein